MREKRKKRSSIEITVNILEVAKDGAKKTRIMYLANIGYYILEKYLNLLIDKNLLEYNPSKKEYKTSDKGSEFLKEYYEFKEAKDDYAKKLKSFKEMIGL